jgi:hypothetical protein
MTKDVKEFIEYNIDYIEKDDWKTVFKNWYIYNKDYYFDDFMDTLEQAGIDVWKESYEVRAKILQQIAKNVFTNLSSRGVIVTFHDIGSELSSLMGFKGQELVHILDMAANSIGMIKTDKGWFKR